ncbi:uncharacterized protein with FMN-binding domain [Streptomyces sp. SAI-170]|uniref:FMN-binding protein n=1 Tax=Streptomyces sp. SAI-170 TaxID=3377729 RepID=UPI003C7AF82A
MKKSHPVRRALLATVATVSGVVLLLSLKPASDPAAAAPPPPPASAAGRPAPGAGTVTGAVAATQYGPVQVRITLAGGRITRAEAVQAPSGGRSTEINGSAVPQLNQEAVAAQSARIDAVSGATYTSEGYRKSLQSALDQAGG